MSRGETCAALLVLGVGIRNETSNTLVLWCLSPNILRCIKILSWCHVFLFFLPSSFLPHKDTFMDDYDGI